MGCRTEDGEILEEGLTSRVPAFGLVLHISFVSSNFFFFNIGCLTDSNIFNTKGIQMENYVLLLVLVSLVIVAPCLVSRIKEVKKESEAFRLESIRSNIDKR